MLKLAFGRVVSAVLTAGGWLVAGARLVLDLIGYSAAPEEDVAVAQSRVDHQLLGYLLALPWWAPLGFALIATLWLMHVSWPRQPPPAAPGGERRARQEPASDRRHPPSPPIAPPAEPTVVETDAERLKKQALVGFIVDAALPAFQKQKALQRQILGVIINNSCALILAMNGLKAEQSALGFTERM
jgi:hypothetical protein